jgi:hypothetical protein
MPRAVSNSPNLVNPDKLKVSSARTEEVSIYIYYILVLIKLVSKLP